MPGIARRDTECVGRQASLPKRSTAVVNRLARAAAARAATAIIAAPLPCAVADASGQGRRQGRGLLPFPLPFPLVLLSLVRRGAAPRATPVGPSAAAMPAIPMN